MKQRLLNKIPLILCSLFFLFLVGCATPEKQIMTPEPPPTESVSETTPTEPTVEPIEVPKLEEVKPPQPEPKIPTELIVIGEVEPVTIVSATATFPARIDTGATTSSIDARDIQRFERDGKAWVRFNLKDRRTGKVSQIESRITRIAEIKRHGTDPQERPVVKLKAKLGGKTLNTEFSLTDRSSFEYPVLVGRNLLDGHFAVDVSKKNTSSLMKEE